MEIARSATTRADGEVAGQVRSAPAAKAAASSCRTPNHWIASLAHRLGDAVERIADDAIDPLDAGGDQCFYEYLTDGLGHSSDPS